MSELAQPILNGILLGGLYALIAIGMSMMFGIVKLVNLAHGDMMILSSYMAMVFSAWLGMNPFIVLVLTMPLMFIVGYLVQGVLINRVLGKAMEPPLLVAFGLSIILQNFLLMVFTPDARSIITSLSTNGIPEYLRFIHGEFLHRTAGDCAAVFLLPEDLSGTRYSRRIR